LEALCPTHDAEINGCEDPRTWRNETEKLGAVVLRRAGPKSREGSRDMGVPYGRTRTTTTPWLVERRRGRRLGHSSGASECGQQAVGAIAVSPFVVQEPQA